MKFKLTENTERVNVTYPRQNRISWTLSPSKYSNEEVHRPGMPNILNISACGDGIFDKETVEPV
jgi:hypothetical protein